MKVERFTEQETETPILLKQVENGEIVRFEHVAFEDALKEDLFYYVLSKKDKRVKLVCLANAEQIERDEDWRVFKHESKLRIYS